MSLPVEFANFVLRVARRLRWVVAGAAMGWLAILYLPIMPAQPICIHDGSGGPHRTLSGGLARDFHTEYVRLLADDIPFFTDGERVYVSFVHSWDFRLFTSASRAATWAVVKRRTGIDHREPGLLPGYAEWIWPSCAAMAAIAFKGGAWEHDGPELIPEGASEAEAAAAEPPPVPVRSRVPGLLYYLGAFFVSAAAAAGLIQGRRHGRKRGRRVVEEAYVAGIQYFSAALALVVSGALLIDQLLFLA